VRKLPWRVSREPVSRSRRAQERIQRRYGPASRIDDLSLLLLAGVFLFLQTGERAHGVCMSERFAAADGVSLWPPGVRCTFGEPARTDVLVNPWLGLVLVTLVAGSAVSLGQRSTRA
jgi:hypothetical protein